MRLYCGGLVRLVKAMVFPVVMYGCESWTMKKAERRRIDAFELWCWRRLLRVPWTARRSSQSILKEISPGCSLEGLMLKLKLQYFGHLMRRVDSLDPDAGRDWGQEEKGDNRGWDGWMASPTWWTWVWVNSGSWWWTGRPDILRFMGLQRVRHDWVTELNWTESLSCVWPLRLPGLYPTRLFHLWDFPGRNTGVACHFCLQGIFLTQGSNPHLLRCRQSPAFQVNSLLLSHLVPKYWQLRCKMEMRWLSITCGK